MLDCGTKKRPRPTQSSTPCATKNKYRLKYGDVLRSESKGLFHLLIHLRVAGNTVCSLLTYPMSEYISDDSDS